MIPRVQFDLRQRHPEFAIYHQENESRSSEIRKKYTYQSNLHYGDHPLQTLDLYTAPLKASPLMVFIHGGYWRGGDKWNYHFLVEHYLKKGISVALVNYRLLPEVRMSELISDVCSAVSWLYDHGNELDIDSHRMVLTGHSAGGHLAIMTYLNTHQLRKSILGICSLSGIFNLRTMHQSYLNDTLQLTPEEIELYSVGLSDMQTIQCPVQLSVGGGESEIFIQETLHFSSIAESSAHISLAQIDELNHYQMGQLPSETENRITSFIFHLFGM